MKSVNQTAARTNKPTAQELKAIYFQYLLDCIDTEGYESVTMTNESSDKEKLEFVLQTFRSEYCYAENLKRYGSYQNTFANWLMGLPSSMKVDFENYRIIELCKSWGVLPANAIEKQEDKIINNWFNFMAAKFFQLCKSQKINVYSILN